MDGGGERRGMELSGGRYETCEGGGRELVTNLGLASATTNATICSRNQY